MKLKEKKRPSHIWFVYHETVGEELDAAVAERGGGELPVSEVAGEDAGRKRHGGIDHVNHDGRSGEAAEEI